MTPEISFADWVDWLAIELTFVELYRSAAPSEQRAMRETVRRIAAGMGEADLDAFVSQVPHFERALGSFSVEEQSRFFPQLSNSVTTLASTSPALSPTVNSGGEMVDAVSLVVARRPHDAHAVDVHALHHARASAPPPASTRATDVTFFGLAPSTTWRQLLRSEAREE